jgi:hypothetical protein
VSPYELEFLISINWKLPQVLCLISLSVSIESCLGMYLIQMNFSEYSADDLTAIVSNLHLQSSEEQRLKFTMFCKVICSQVSERTRFIIRDNTTYLKCVVCRNVKLHIKIVDDLKLEFNKLSSMVDSKSTESTGPLIKILYPIVQQFIKVFVTFFFLSLCLFILFK